MPGGSSPHHGPRVLASRHPCLGHKRHILTPWDRSQLPCRVDPGAALGGIPGSPANSRQPRACPRGAPVPGKPYQRLRWQLTRGGTSSPAAPWLPSAEDKRVPFPASKCWTVCYTATGRFEHGRWGAPNRNLKRGGREAFVEVYERNSWQSVLTSERPP